MRRELVTGLAYNPASAVGRPAALRGSSNTFGSNPPATLLGAQGSTHPGHFSAAVDYANFIDGRI
jgi:hypothetical protein